MGLPQDHAKLSADYEKALKQVEQTNGISDLQG
jgi:hypothetical protein